MAADLVQWPLSADYRRQRVFRDGGRRQRAVFTVYPEGLAVVDFRLVMPGSGASREIRTAVLPLSDYFLLGEPFR